MMVQSLKLSIFPECTFSTPLQVFGQGPSQGTHSPFNAFFLGGQDLTQAPLSFRRCSGHLLTQVAPYAYLPSGLGSHEYVVGLYLEEMIRRNPRAVMPRIVKLWGSFQLLTRFRIREIGKQERFIDDKDIVIKRGKPG